MQPPWISWIGFLVLAALISVTSCQVWQSDPTVMLPGSQRSESSQ